MLLIGLNTGLVLLAVLCVSIAGVRLLRRLGDEQALARVSLAGTNALQAVERSARDVAVSAHLLGERPTVGRLLGQGDAGQLTAFLDRFRGTSRLSGCAVLLQGRPVAASGPSLPWKELRRAAPGDNAAVVAPSGRLMLAAASPLTTFPGSEAVTALQLDEPFVREISRQVGLPVAILPVAALPEEDARRDLRERAQETGASASGELADVYLAVQPLRGPDGAVIALVETSLPTAPVASSLARLIRNLLWIALVVVALASLSGLLISRRLAGPMSALTSAAARIGRGDLATPVPRAPGEELGTLAVTLEESRRQLLRLTSELRRRQAEGEAILTGISEGVYSVDRDRKIRYLNPQAARLLGITPEAAIGRFCGEVLKPAPGPGGIRPCEDQCPILHARFRGATRATERLQLADGTQKVVTITSAPPTEDLQFQVFSDETEQDAARRLRDAVLANISHEFRTPLAAQRASLELLRERLDEMDRQAREAEEGADASTRRLVLSLERGSLRLTQLVDNLLESVRIEAGHASLRRSPVALDEVVEDAVEMTAPLLAQRNQRLEVDLPYPLPEVEGDGPRLTQVFVNLLANAQKFAPADSLVRIGGEVRPEVVILWVEDEGPGVPGGAGRSLFERFVRAPGRDDNEPEQSGMGLGLWIVQSIIERHGGTVEARREGAGTRVRITLPRRPVARKTMERATA
jgi:signal transduction histidine kinase